MSPSIRQTTRVGYNSNTRISNTYPRKRGRITNLPRNSVIVFEKDFSRADLKERIARLKSSPKYKAGEAKARAQLKSAKAVRLRKNQNLNINNGNLKINISTS